MVRQKVDWNKSADEFKELAGESALICQMSELIGGTVLPASPLAQSAQGV